MTNSAGLPKFLLVFGIVLPLAAFIGYVMATPQDNTTLATLAAVFGVMSIPLFLKWHQPMLIFSWNAAINLAFLPGNPYLWVPVAVVSFFLTIMTTILNKEVKLVQVKSITWTLLAFAVIVLLTAKLTGGLGVRSLGGSKYGGSKYFLIFFAVIGYFAMSAQKIPVDKALSYGRFFMLSGTTAALSNLIYYLPSLWFLYYLVPVEHAMSQAAEDFSVAAAAGTRFSRLGGIAWAALAGYYYMQMRFGVRGILDLSKPNRLFIAAALAGLSMLGGYRSILILFVVCFAVQYCLEGLLRSRWTVVLLLTAVMGLALLIPFARQLPIPIQRALSLLPVDIDPAVRFDADASSDWRVRMWKVLLPEIPKYFFLGKGFTASASDYLMLLESSKRGTASDFEATILAGDYHSGPLSLIIPFGIWGFLAFLAFNIAGLRAAYLNYKYGDPPLQTLNTFLLSALITRVFFFYFIYGAVHADLAIMAGLVGMSVSLNGGVKKPVGLESRPATVAESNPNAAPVRVFPIRA